MNHFYCPAGRRALRGWLLLPRADYARLDPYSADLRLSVGDPRRPDNVGVLGGLAVVQARCATRGLASDAGALYLVEVTDARGLLSNRWFSQPTTTSYNIRAPAYPDVFHPASMNGGTTWTWETMLQDLWQQMGARLGAWPGLPAAPAGVPEGMWHPGVGAWGALCDALDHLGLAVAGDLTRAAPYTIVSTGADDAAFAAAQARYASRLEDDLDWLDVGAGRVPGTVKVLFRRRNVVYGTEETVTYRSDGMARQWDMGAVYEVTVAAPAAFASAVGEHHIWSDFTVRHDQDSNPLAADAAAAAAIAAERVSQYFDRIYSRGSGYMSQTYAGALPFATGPQVDGVCWYMHDGGWRTQVVRGQHLHWPGLWD